MAGWADPRCRCDGRRRPIPRSSDGGQSSRPSSRSGRRRAPGPARSCSSAASRAPASPGCWPRSAPHCTARERPCCSAARWRSTGRRTSPSSRWWRRCSRAWRPTGTTASPGQGPTRDPGRPGHSRRSGPVRSASTAASCTTPRWSPAGRWRSTGPSSSRSRTCTGPVRARSCCCTSLVEQHRRPPDAACSARIARRRRTARDALVQTIASLYRHDDVRRMDLPALDTEDIADYLVAEARIPRSRARLSATLLRDQTGGNPFFLRELWRDVSAGGGLEVLRSASFRAPASVRDTIEQRLNRSGRAAAADGGARGGHRGRVRSRPRCWPPPSGRDDTTLTALDTALAAGIVEPSGDGGADGIEPVSFRFPHALARAAVLDLMPRSRRAHEHRRVGEIVEQQGEPDADGRPARQVQRLAYHFANAPGLGCEPKAVRYLIQAARFADASLAHEDAATWFTRAGALTEDPEERSGLLLAAARSHLLGGDFAAGPRAGRAGRHVREYPRPGARGGRARGRVVAAGPAGAPVGRAAQRGAATRAARRRRPALHPGARQPRTGSRVHRRRDRAPPPSVTARSTSLAPAGTTACSRTRCRPACGTDSTRRTRPASWPGPPSSRTSPCPVTSWASSDPPPTSAASPPTCGANRTGWTAPTTTCCTPRARPGRASSTTWRVACATAPSSGGPISRPRNAPPRP